jgi:hypothetical protein
MVDHNQKKFVNAGGRRLSHTGLVENENIGEAENLDKGG